MKKMIKSLAPLFLALGLSSTEMWAAEDTAATDSKSKTAAKETELFGDSVVAKGKGLEIKRSQLDDEVIRVKAQASAAGRPIPSEQSSLIERQILDSLIQFRVLLAKATEADLMKGKEQFTASLQQARTNRNMSQEEFNQWQAPQVKLLGLSREQWISESNDLN